MTVKLIVLYTQPEDRASFDSHYRDTHLPLAQKLPGLQRLELATVGAAADGGDVPYYQVVELYFADQGALQAAFASEEGKATAADYGTIAPAGSRMLIAEVSD